MNRTRSGRPEIDLRGRTNEGGRIRGPLHCRCVRWDDDRVVHHLLRRFLHLLARVLRVADGLLGLALHLVALAAGFEIIVVHDLARLLLRLPLQLIDGTFGAIALSCHLSLLRPSL